MSKRSKYARVGEFVKVVRPMRFVRVGYPLTYNILLETRAEEVWDLATKAAEGMGLFAAVCPGLTLLPSTVIEQNPSLSKLYTINGKIRSYLEKAACAKLIKDAGFGGKERKIYEQEIELRPGNWLVTAKSFVKTGTYHRGYTRQTWYGDYDYEPASLASEQTHCVYTLKHDQQAPFRTLATNCERISDVS